MSLIASQITSLTIVYSPCLFRHRSKKTSKLRVTGLCEGNSPGTSEFPAQNVSIWWRHHASWIWDPCGHQLSKTPVKIQSYYSDNTWASWSLQSQATRLCVQHTVFSVTTKETQMLRTTGSLWEESNTMDHSPHKGPVNSSVHVPVSSKRSRVLLLIHGWPGSVWEFVKVLPLLTDSPNPEDAFEVICPSIPGFGFSEAPKKRGKSAISQCRRWHHTKLNNIIGCTVWNKWKRTRCSIALH